MNRGDKRRVMNSMVMKSEVMNSGGDERRVMDDVVINVALMDGTLTGKGIHVYTLMFHSISLKLV